MEDAYATRRRAATAANGGVSPNGTHGLASTYNNHFCRCEPCTSAKREQNADQRMAPVRVDPAFLPIGAERMRYVDAPWMADGLCREVGSEAFFPEKGESAMPAKRICRQCSVTSSCLEFALTVDAPLFGVWGATTEYERRRMRRTG